MSDNDDDLSSAIRNFITGQHATPHPPTPPQPEPEPEPEPEPQPVPPPRPAPRHQENSQIMFVYDGEEIQFSEVDATPTAVADHFELDREDIYLQRNDRTFHVHATEDRFKTSLRPGRRYTVLKRETQTRTTPRRQTEQNSRECTLIANGQRKAIPAGTVRRVLIATTFGLGRNVEDIKLIGYDGTVINNRQQYELNPGATYHVVYTDQKALELAKDDEHEESSESFSKAMSLMAPFMVAVVRSLYAMSFTGEKVTFTTTTPTTNTDPTKLTSKLLCSNKLSTGAYQVTYRYNTAFKAIQNLTKILSINFENDDDSLDVFSHSEEAEILCNSLSHAINLLEKAHAELEELLNIVVTEMRIANPSVESVRISLKIETNQEKRTLEKEETKKIDKTVLDEKCDKIFLNDEEIRPPIDDLNTISNNRKLLNKATELVEKVLADLDDTVALEDVTNLLDFCAKISHKNLMHWIFAYNVFETLKKDTDDAEKTTVGYRRKRNIGNRIYDALQFWKIVSRGVSLSVNMNEESDDVHELWSKLKDTIITAQYALEIRHDE